MTNQNDICSSCLVLDSCPHPRRRLVEPGLFCKDAENSLKAGITEEIAKKRLQWKEEERNDAVKS